VQPFSKSSFRVFLVIGLWLCSVWRGYFPVSGIDARHAVFAQTLRPTACCSNPSRISICRALFHPRLLLQRFYTGAAVCFTLGCLRAVLCLNVTGKNCVAIRFCSLFSKLGPCFGLPITERGLLPDALIGKLSRSSQSISPFATGWASR